MASFARVSFATLLLALASASVLAQTDAKPANPLFPIEVNDRSGYIDRSGTVVIPPHFDFGDEFSEGLAVVKIGEKWGYIDETGKVVIEAKFSGARPFSEGLARVQVGGDKYSQYGKWGFIDHSGKVVIEPQFVDGSGTHESSFDFHEGRAMVEVEGAKGFIDPTGRLVIAPRYRYAYRFTEGLASVSLDNADHWGYIDKDGNWAIPPNFKWASAFTSGLAPVNVNGTCGYIDRTGNLKLQPPTKIDVDCATVWGSFDDGLSRWKSGEMYGFIDTTGKFVIPAEFDLTFNFSEGLAFVVKDGITGFIDTTGRMVIKPQFYDAKDFHNGLARVVYSRTSWGYIDRTGKFVWRSGAAAGTPAPAVDLQTGHTRDLLFVGWSPDGKLVASYSAADDDIMVWDPETGKKLWGFDTDDVKPDAPLVSPGGRWSVTGSETTSFEIRDSKTSAILWTIKARSAGPDRVLSPDESFAAERGRYGDAVVTIFDTKTNRAVRRLEGHPGIVHALAYSPDGALIASGSGDLTIKLWESRTGRLVRSLAGHTRGINSLAFSGDGKLIVSGSEDDTIKVWDAVTGQQLSTTVGFSSGLGGAKSVAFSPDATMIAASSGVSVRVFDRTGKLLQTFTTNESHTSGDHGWCCGSAVRVVLFTPDGKLIISAQEDATIKLWQLGRDEPLRLLKRTHNDIRSIAVSPNGKTVAVSYHAGEAPIELWSLDTGKVIKSFSNDDANYVRSIAFSADGTKLVSGHMADDVNVWDVATGRSIKAFDQPYSSDDVVAFSPDGKHVVSGGENQNVIQWNLETGKMDWSVIPIDWAAEQRALEAASIQYAAEKARQAEHEKFMAGADEQAKAWVPLVAVTFDHFGDAVDRLEQRIFELGTPKFSIPVKSRADADGVWLRLRNNSPNAIEFSTDSSYLLRPNCGVKLANGKNGPGLCDGAEIVVKYTIVDASGKRIVTGIDMSSSTILPPGASVLFSVPLEHLTRGMRIIFDYKFQYENKENKLEDYGSEHRLEYRGESLPAK